MPLRLALALLAVGVCVAPARPAGAIVYVDQSRPGGNGTSWGEAYQSLATAVSLSTAGQEFWVADGTYGLPAGLSPKSGTKLYGGFSGSETARDQRNPAANVTVLHGQGTAKHVVRIRPTALNVVVDGFTVTGGHATGVPGYDTQGGGILIQQVATVANCVFTANAADTQGGAIFVDRVPATITGSTFTSNASPGIGGAVFVYQAAATIDACTFGGNSSQQGGAIAGHEATLTVTRSVFNGNTAAGGLAEGGAIGLNLCSATIADSTFTGNSAGHGGAIDLNNAGTVSLERSTFTGNSSAISGGAVATMYCTVSISSCTFDGNTTSLVGGGYYSHTAATTIRDSTFRNNRVTAVDGSGGGVMLDYKLAGTDVVERSTFSNNSAAFQGGGLYSFARSILIDSSAFVANSARYGGAVRTHVGETPDGTYNPDYTVRLRNCTLYGNHVSQYGGGMANTGLNGVPTVTLDNCILWGNSAGFDGLDPGSADISNFGSAGLATRSSDILTLASGHGSYGAESHTDGFSLNPLFQDADGADNVLGTADDNLRLTVDSPCVDRADGSLAPALDILGFPRSDEPGVPDAGTGTPTYADVGAYERVVPVADPQITPAGGEYGSSIAVSMSCATAGATIRYTTDGTDPGPVSPAYAGPFVLTRGALVKARGYRTGNAESNVVSVLYTMTDTDGDGLPDWVETGTGTYVSDVDTGTDPRVADTDGDGWSDGREVARRTDPTDPASFPRTKNDFDGDGIADLGVYKPKGGVWSFLLSSQGPATQLFGRSGTIPVTGDFDGDNVADYGFYLPYRGRWKFMMSTRGYVTTRFGFDRTVPVTGDFDGDGVTDFGYARGGRWRLRMSTRGDVSVRFGEAGRVPVTGDFDGDGTADFGRYHALSGMWYFLMSSRGPVSAQFGSPGTVPVTGDFDGDGVTDYGCYSPAAGSWSFMMSTRGFTTAQLGAAGTVPVTGDFDGDGVTDYGTYAAAAGTWQLMMSSRGPVTEQLGSAGTVPIGSRAGN